MLGAVPPTINPHPSDNPLLLRTLSPTSGTQCPLHTKNHKEFTLTDPLPDPILLGIHSFKTSYLEEILANAYVF